MTLVSNNNFLILVLGLTRTHNIGFATRLAGRWNNGHFYRYQHHLGRINIAELLFVNFYIYIFIQQRFRAGRAMNASPAASPDRCRQLFQTSWFTKINEGAMLSIGFSFGHYQSTSVWAGRMLLN